MRDELLLSYFFPQFTVQMAERFIGSFCPGGLTPENLALLGFDEAANWLIKNEEWFFQSCPKIRNQIKEFRYVTWLDENYPNKLRAQHCPAPFLFYLGDLNLIDEHPTIGIVGAREPTNLGVLWLEEAVPEIVKEGGVIISGGARGIDYEAHSLALKAKGKTVAFVPGGIDKLYPRSNDYLFEEIQKSGLIITEFLPGTRIDGRNFERRNRLIAAASCLVVIVEAKMRSGTMITARHANSEGRDLYVLPGPPMIPNYHGSLHLLTQGAMLAIDGKSLISNAKQKTI